MNAPFFIACKDLRQRLRDKSAFLYGIVAPLALAFIFSFVFNPIQESSFHAEYVVVDQDGGQIAQAFKQSLAGLEDDGVATIREVDTPEEAETQVEAGSDAFAGDDVEQADAAFVLPAGLSEGVLAGEGGEVTVVGAAGSQLAAQVALSIAEGFASELAAVEVAVQTVAHSGAVDPASIPALAQDAATIEDPVSIEDVSAETKQLDQTTYMAAGMSVFFLFFTVSFGVSGLLEERRIGTMDRLLAAPIGRRAIIVGKALTSFALGVISMAVLVVATSLLLGAEWGNPIGVAVLVAAVVFSAMGILAIVAATAKTPDQAGSFQAIISLVLAFMGGVFFEVAQAGGIMRTLSLFTPHAWFMRGLADLQGGDLSAIWPAVGALLAFGVVTGGVAWVFLEKSVRR